MRKNAIIASENLIFHFRETEELLRKSSLFDTVIVLAIYLLTHFRTLFRIRSQTTDVNMNQNSSKAHAKILWKY